MHWYNKKVGPPGSKLAPVKYRVRTPGKMLLKRTDGLEVSFGFGIGDTFEIMEPSTQYLIASFERSEEIRMPDGTIILDFDPSMQVEQCPSTT